MLPAANALAAFGFEEVDVTFTEADGTPAMQAGSHPFAMTTTLRLNTVENAGTEAPDGALRNLWIEYPAGLVAYPSAVPACSDADFVDIEGDENECSDSTAIGIAKVTASSSGPVPLGTPDFRDPQPVYKLTPIPGSIARIGFVAAGEPVEAELGVADAPPHNGFLALSNLTQDALFYSVRVSIWGNPAHFAHDSERGRCAFGEGICPTGNPVSPLLTMPRSCTGPLEMRFQALSWQEPPQAFETLSLSHDNAEPPQPLGLHGCGSLAFSPQFAAQPTTDLADTPSGLDLSLDFYDEGLLNSGGVAESEAKGLALVLPEGMIVNPESANGLVACTPAQLAQETVDSAPGDGCPPGSQVGTVETETPLLPGAVLEGDVFAALPEAVYVVLRSPQLGILIRQVGEIEYDAFAERLTVAFDHLPQLPISHFGLHLDEGQGPFLTPAECDEHVIEAAISPWSKPSESLSIPSIFETIAGPAGGLCPSGRERPVVGSSSLPVNQPLASPPPPGRSLPDRAKRRRCPKGKRWARGKARCVRRCRRRARAGSSAVRRCAPPKGRRRR
jgi:hypothetical protein